MVTHKSRCTVVVMLTLTAVFSAAILSNSHVAAQYPWNYEPVSDDGGEISIAVDSTGRVHATFARNVGSSWELVYALRTGSSWSFQRVDAQSSGPSLVLDSSEEPRISYYRESDNTVRYAHLVGTSFVNETIEQVNCTAYTTSLALDKRGPVHITYWDYCNPAPYLDYLRHAVRNESGWTVETVGTGFINPDDRAPIEVDSTGHPHIAVLRFMGGEPPGGLRYLSWNGSGWSNEQANSPSDGSALEDLSFKLDSNDVPHIVYSDATEEKHRYARYEVMFKTWLHQDVYVWPPSSFHIAFGRISLALDRRNLPSVSFMDHTDGSLMYAYSDGTRWFAENVQSSPGISGHLALGLDSLGAPHIMYGQVTMPNPSRLPVEHAWQVWPDTVPPSSNINPIKPYWHKSQPLQLSASATDAGSGVANVTLWYRHCADNSTWGSWTQYSTLSSPPWTWSFAFPAGEGYYEYYSTAVDIMGNVEPPPAAADAIEGYDSTPPVSTALPTSPYWHTSPSIVVDATATDNLSGVEDVTLLHSHASLDNSTWSQWTSAGTKTIQPWSWSFTFQDGEGHYKFHTIARDVAGNAETDKTTAEAVAGYRHLPDYAPADPLPSPPITTGLSKQVTLSVHVENLNGSAETMATIAFFNASTPSSPFKTIPLPPIPAGDISGPFTAMWSSPATPAAYQVSVSVDYCNDITESGESNNVYTWTVNVVEGLITSLVIGNPKYDSTATYLKSTTSLDLSVMDQSGTGTKYTRYRIDNVTWTDYSSSYYLAGDGDHYIEYYSEDNVGNVEDVSWRVLKVDDTPPSISISPGDAAVSIDTLFTLAANDGRGCGVATLEYRIDNGSWTAYSSPFALSAGWHNVTYRSWDHLNNSVERTHAVEVVSPEVPPGGKVEVNYKPIIALIFAIILAVAGLWSSKKRPWKGGKDGMAVVKAFVMTSMPFVFAETVTGIVSFLTGLLSIPPSVGIGTAMDMAILLAGLVVGIARALMTEPSKTDMMGRPKGG